MKASISGSSAKSGSGHARGAWRWLLVAIAAAGLLALTATLYRPSGARSRGTETQWEYKFLPDRTLSAFDLRFRVQPKSADRVRLFLEGLENGDGSFVELGPEGVASGRITAGLERRGRTVRSSTLRDLADTLMVLERRPHRWSLVSDGLLVAEWDHPPGEGRRIAFGAPGPKAASGTPRFYDVRFQPVSDIFFADTFMRTPEDPTAWTEISGTWEVNRLRDPLLSANAFHYSASSETVAASVVGEWFWSDIEVSVACRPAPGGAVGLYLCYRGPDDYYLFRWTSRGSEKPVKQLVRRTGKEDHIIAQALGGYAPGQWYNLKALIGSGWVSVGIDDAHCFTVREPGLTHGQIGLHVEGTEPAMFDDVKVAGRCANYPDFDRYHFDRWLTVGGEWRQIAPAEWDRETWAGGVVVRAPDRANLVWGDSSWRSYTLGALLGPWQEGALGLCFRYQDALNFYSVRWQKASRPALRLCRTDNGRDKVLAEVPVPEDHAPHRLGVSSERGSIIVSVDGRAVMRAFDFSFLGGRCGLFAEGIRSGNFSEVAYDFLPERLPLSKFHRAFSAETSMSVWAQALSDWTKNAHTGPDGNSVEVNWHRSDFHGDVRADVRLPAPPGPGSEFGIVLNGNGVDLTEGFVVRLRRPSEEEGSKDGVVAELVSGDEVLTAKSLSWSAGGRVLKVQRVGRSLAVFCGDDLLLVLHDADPGDGRRLGWYAAGIPTGYDDIEIYSENVVNCTFNTAPTEWRVGSGIWGVTNKWQCDPRWSFFSGSGDGLAALWSKRPIEGDFTIEYYVGNKMDRERGGRYEYAKDMNITVCADGKDLTSGYTFLFGGFDNSITCLYRGKERFCVPAPDKRIVIDRKGLHRRWYHVRVSRTQNRLEMRIDDQVVLSKTDDDPLTGGHWALWTWNNGITIARVRISAEHIGKRDSPDIVWPETTQALYK